MIQGVDLSQRIEITLEGDLEPKTIFVIRPLSGLEMTELQQSSNVVISTLEKSVVEIKGQPNTLTAIEYVKTLGMGHLTDLLQKVAKINNISLEQSKK